MKCKKPAGFIISIACIFVMLFSMAGCKAVDTPNSKDAMEESAYSYEASELNTAMALQNISSPCINSKGEIAVFDEEKEKILILDKKGALLREIPDTFKGGMSLAYGTGDKLYALLQYYKRKGSEVTGMITELVIYDEQGQKSGDKIEKEARGDAESFKGKFIIKMMPDKNGNLYVRKSDGTVEVLDKSLNSIKAWDRVKYSDFAVDEKDNLILLQRNTGGKIYIQKFDVKNDKAIWEKELKVLDAPDYIYCNRNSGKLYGLQDGVIFNYDSKGDVDRRLLDIKELSAFDYITGFLVDDEEEIYVQSYDDEKSNIICFVKQDASEQRAAEGNKKRLIIHMSYDFGNAISNAIIQYEKEHPDVDIKINDIREISFDEMIQKLNAELMAGKGPDIIFGDFPIADYKEKGLIANLSEFIDGDKSFNIKDYDENLINASKADYGLYSLPVDYYMECFLVNTKLVEQKEIPLKKDMTWEELYTVIREANRKPDMKIYMLPEMGPQALFYYIIYGDIDYYVDKENRLARFDSQEFIRALELMKRIDDEHLFHPDIDGKKIIHSDGEFAPEDILFIPITFVSYKQIYECGKYYNSFDVIPAIRGLSTDIREVRARNIAINSNSQYKEEAWEFIKLLLSEEMQLKLSESNNLPVNNKADERSEADMFSDKDGMPPDWYRPTDEDMDNLKSLMAEINKIEPFDIELNEIVRNEVEQYMKNEKSAQDTAKAVQNKVMLYLQE